MFRDSPFIVRLAGNAIITLLLAVCVIWGTTIFYDYDKSDFLKLMRPPQLYSAKNINEPIHALRPGDALVIKYDIEKHEIGCFAEYVYTFSGPVGFSHSAGKSRNIGHRGEIQHFTIKGFIPIPETLPTGIYKIQLNVFPICDGVPRDPFSVFKPQPLVQVY